MLPKNLDPSQQNMFPLRLLPSRGGEFLSNLTLEELALSGMIDSGGRLVGFPAGQLTTDPATHFDLKIDEYKFELTFVPGLTLEVTTENLSNHFMLAKYLEWYGAPFTFAIDGLLYSFIEAEPFLHMRLQSVKGQKFRGGEEIMKKIQDAVTEKFSDFVRSLRIGQPSYDLFADIDPLRTASEVLVQLRTYSAQADAEKLLGQRQDPWWKNSLDDYIRGAVEPEEGSFTVPAVRFTGFKAAFRVVGPEPFQKIRPPSKTKRERGISFRPGSSPTLLLDINISLDEVTASIGQANKVDLVQRLRPSKMHLGGEIRLIYDQQHVATMDWLDFYPDGRVLSAPPRLTAIGERMLSPVVDVDRMVFTGLGALQGLLAAFQAAGGVESFRLLAGINPQAAVGPVLAGAAEGYDSHVVVPVVTNVIKEQIEEALSEVLTEYVKLFEEKFGVSLESFLHGAKLKFQ